MGGIRPVAKIGSNRNVLLHVRPNRRLRGHFLIASCSWFGCPAVLDCRLGEADHFFFAAERATFQSGDAAAPEDTHMQSSRFVRFSVAAVISLAAAPCGGNDDGARDTSNGSKEEHRTRSTTRAGGDDDAQHADGGDMTVAVEIVDTDFRPPVVSVQAGTSVEWTQIGDQPHSVSAGDGSFDSNPICSPIDSDKCLGMGDRFSHRFDTPGTFIYYCKVHGLPDGTGMVGKIVVE